MSRPLRVGSLFTGVGGVELALSRVLDVELAWVSDIEPGPVKVLAHRHPDVPNIGDVTKVNWVSLPRVDVFAGGFPCTDVSPLGLRQGLRPGTRSGLWAHMAYGIDQLRPRLVFIENVRGLLSADAHSEMELCPWCLGDGESTEPVLRAHGAVQADLARLGYDSAWVPVRACDVGAPHQRPRVFILGWSAADTEDIGHERSGPARGRRDGSADRTLAVADRDWGPYAAAVARWERVLGRPAPAPLAPGTQGQDKIRAEFTEWMMGYPEGWVTDVPGVTWNEALRALGNGLVPAQGAEGLRQLLDLRAAYSNTLRNVS